MCVCTVPCFNPVCQHKPYPMSDYNVSVHHCRMNVNVSIQHHCSMVYISLYMHGQYGLPCFPIHTINTQSCHSSTADEMLQQRRFVCACLPCGPATVTDFLANVPAASHHHTKSTQLLCMGCTPSRCKSDPQCSTCTAYHIYDKQLADNVHTCQYSCFRTCCKMHAYSNKPPTQSSCTQETSIF